VAIAVVEKWCATCLVAWQAQYDALTDNWPLGCWMCGAYGVPLWRFGDRDRYPTNTARGFDVKAALDEAWLPAAPG
jgi:hypothetical protein